MSGRHAFLSFQIAFIVITAMLLLWFFPIAGSLDLSLISPWITSNGEFFLKNNWALATLNHHYIKYLLIAAYLGILLLWIKSFRQKQPSHMKWQYGYFFIAVIVSTSLIGFIKSQSGHACPWDMTIPTTQGFSWNFSVTGHCFPGGHASTGFALMIGYFVFRLDQPKRAYFYLIAGLILGFAMGWAQMMRGAHFLSHNLWTAWVIWSVNSLGYYCFYHDLVKNQPSTNDDLTTSSVSITGKVTTTFNPPKV